MNHAAENSVFLSHNSADNPAVEELHNWVDSTAGSWPTSKKD